MAERIEIEITGRSDSAVSAAERTRDALRGVDDQARSMAGQTGKAGEALESVRRAGEPAGRILSGFERAARGGTDAVRGLYDVISGLFSVLRSGFGIGGIVATAGVVLGTWLLKLADQKKPAEDATKSLEDFAKAAGQLERANLATLSEGFAELKADADESIKRFDEALARRKRLEDAQSETEIAQIRSRQRAGSITDEQAAEQIASVQLERELRNAATPAERAAIEARDAGQKASIAKAEEAAILARLEQANALANFFQSDQGRLREQIANAERQQAGTGSALPDAAERVRLGEEIRRLTRETEKAKAGQEAQNARLKEISDELYKAVEARSKAEESASKAAERAAAEAATARAQSEQIIIRSQAERVPDAGAAQDRALQTLTGQRQTARLGEDVQRGLSRFQPTTPEAQQAFTDTRRAAESLGDGGTRDELAALVRELSRLVEAARSVDSPSVKQLQAILDATRARVATTDAALAQEDAREPRGRAQAEPTEGRRPQPQSQGVIEIDGRRIDPDTIAPRTPIRETSVPETRTREQAPGTIDIRDREGRPVQIPQPDAGADAAAIGDAVSTAIDPLAQAVSALPTAIAEGAAQGVAAGLSEIPRRATGGEVRKKEPTVVGEQGPEIFTPPNDGFISSNAEATSGRYAPQRPIDTTQPRADVIRSNAEALAVSAAQSYARGSLDGSDRASANAVRGLAERDPERFQAITREAVESMQRTAEASAKANQRALSDALATITKQNQRIEGYMRELVIQGRKTKVA